MTNYINLNGGTDAPATWREHYEQGIRLMRAAEAHPNATNTLLAAVAHMAGALVKYIEKEEAEFAASPGKPAWQEQNDLLWQARTAAEVHEFTEKFGCSPAEYLKRHPLPEPPAADLADQADQAADETEQPLAAVATGVTDAAAGA